MLANTVLNKKGNNTKYVNSISILLGEIDYDYAKNSFNQSLLFDKRLEDLRKEGKTIAVYGNTIYVAFGNGGLGMSCTPDNMEKALNNILIDNNKKMTIDEINHQYKQSDFNEGGVNDRDNSVRLFTKK